MADQVVEEREEFRREFEAEHGASKENAHRVRIIEPLTYMRGMARSYFRDLVLAERGDHGAEERLRRHEQEMRVELPRREQAARTTLDGREVRTDPNRTAGQGGYFSPPLWLIDEFAVAPRPGRVLAALMPRLPLPQGVQSVNLPRLVTGTLTAVTADLAAPGGQDFTDAAVTSPVVTIAGQGNVSLQLLEQSPPGPHLDRVVFTDLANDYDAQLEKQLLTGTGTGGEFTGLLSLSAPATGVTYTSATPTATEMYPYLGQAFSYVSNTRRAAPEAWLMRGGRWAWFATGEDAQKRPLDVPGVARRIIDNPALPDPIGGIIGVPAYADEAIPANLGAGTNQDVVVACRPSDMLLLESDPRTSVMFDVVSGTLQARLQLHGYVAALTGRYPSGVATVQGTGTIVPAGF